MVLKICLGFGGSILERRPTATLLGFKLSHALSWHDHIDNVSQKINRKIALLQQCRFLIDRRTARIFYFQFIYCYLIYGVHIYFNLAPSSISNQLFVLQKRAFRLVAGYNRIPYHLIPTNYIAKSLGLLPLPDLARYFTCVMCYKINHKLCPKYISDDFLEINHRFPLRSTNLLYPPNNSFLQKISLYFNDLPIELRSLCRFKHFKISLFNFLIDRL